MDNLEDKGNAEEELGQHITTVYPIVEDEFKPKVGMQFDYLPDALNFYTSYSKMAGFGVRKHSTNYHRRTKELCSQVFVCSKEGHSKEDECKIQIGYEDDNNNDGTSTSKRKREIPHKGKKRTYSIIREDCQARIRVTKNKEGTWKVMHFEEGHSHALITPSKTHFLRSHRHVTSVHRNLIDTFAEANKKTCQLMSVLEIEAGGAENIVCTAIDSRNVQTKNKAEIKEFDVKLLIEHFEEMKEMNDSFFYCYEVDDDGRLKHCFWADGIARKNYQLFSDVMIFDKTYDTNKYALVFTPFTGVNHHRQTITFGCAFLGNERIESFVWLFETFLKCMDGKHPGAIITDQDPTMDKAIKLIFPSTYHRFCIWHILKKETEKLGAIAHKREFYESFHSLIYGAENREEFESQWSEIMKDNCLEENEWLKSIYAIRQAWVPVYSKGIFLAGIRSSQRSESQNSFYSRYANKKNSLVEFIHRFERAIKRQRLNEAKESYENSYKNPKLVTPFKMECKMAKVYTRKIFYKFQEELQYSLVCCSSHKKLDGEDVEQYDVTCCRNNKELVAHVTYTGADSICTCSCKLLESEGIPCRHLLYVLRLNEGDIFPQLYVVKRWTIEIAKEVVFDGDRVKFRSDCNKTIFSNGGELHCIFNRLAEKTYLSSEKFELAKQKLLEIEKLVEDVVDNPHH